MISIHTLFNAKTGDNVDHRLRSRIVVHENLDAEKVDVGGQCAAAAMLLVRMVLCLAAFLGFTFGCADIKAPFMQSGPITLKVYVIPPRDFPH